MNSQAITGLPLTPSNSSDATSKSYVDKLTGLVNAFTKLTDGVIVGPTDGSYLVYDSSAYKQITVTGAGGTGAIATIRFAETTSIPFSPGQTIVVSGISPIGYNTGSGGATVVSATSTSVSYANTTSTTYISGGIITATGAWRNTIMPTGDVNITYTQVVQCYATNTTGGATNTVTLSFPLGQTTANLQVNWPIVFSGTTFGNIVSGTTYYIYSIQSTYTIQLTTALGGSVFNLSTASGNVYGTAGGFLTSTIQAQKITNSMVNATAGIVQSKLSLQAADTNATAPGSFTQSVLGLSRYNSAVFTSTYGWIDLKTSTGTSDGVGLNKLTQISDDRFLGNKSGSTGAVTTYSSGQIVTYGDGIKNANFSAASSIPIGAMIVNYNASNGTSSNTYSIIAVSSVGAASQIVRSDANANVDSLNGFKINGSQLADRSSNTFQYYTPQGFKFFTTIGPDEAGTSTNFYGTVTTSKTLTVTTGGLTVSGGGLTVTGVSSITGATTITGNTTVTGTLAVSGTNNLTVGNNATVSGTLQNAAITSGGSTTAGTLTGQWTVAASGYIDLATNAATLYSTTLNANHPGSSGQSGYITGYWNVSSGSRLTATYADLAEYYEGDQDYEPGTVLVFGGEKEVTTSTEMNDTRLAGVVTTNPAYVMNEEQTGIKVCLALAGRVPCKVVGRVKKGDMLTTSSTPGYAVKASNPTIGAIIGKAIEDKDYGEAGVIQVAVGRM